MSRIGFRRALVIAASAWVLSACGGGGSASSEVPGVKTVAPRAPLPTLSTDTNPSGPRIDVASRNYFPAALGDQWAYDILLGTASTRDSTLSRAVTAAEANGNVAIAETYQNTTDIQLSYRRTAEGVSVLPLSSSVPQVVQDQVGRLVQYPEPFYAVGQQRVIVRQGSWGADLDGDGIAESFRFEFRQTLASLDTLTVASQPIADVAQFQNVVTLMVQPSDASYEPYTVTTLENAWWAPGIGLVRYDYRADGSDGDVVTAPYTLLLTGGVVAGEALFAPQPDGVVTKITLQHNDVVYDTTRGVYYASVPGSVAVHGNRIAIINATTGVVSYSATAVGSEPGELAVSADGSALYVGLNGAGQVLKLVLPGMAEQWRVALPTDGFFGQRFAEDLAVSPLNPDWVAVANAVPNVSPRHAGIVLIKGGVLQPRTPSGITGGNQIVFDGNGQYVYGYNSETTEFGLRRFALLADGLEQDVPVVATNSSFAPQSLDWANGHLALGRKVYQTPDLALAGTAPSAGGLCVWIHAGTKLVCASQPPAMSPVDAALEVVNGTTWTVEASPVYQLGYGAGYLRQIVAGPVGTVALSMHPIGSGVGKDADRLWLFKAPALE